MPPAGRETLRRRFLRQQNGFDRHPGLRDPFRQIAAFRRVVEQKQHARRRSVQFRQERLRQLRGGEFLFRTDRRKDVADLLESAAVPSGADAVDLLNAYGDAMGRRFAGIVHCITSVPGVSGLIWRHVDSIMDRMSGENLGYQRRIVSEPPEMFGVDILSCPYHELARELGNEKAVLCICHMDKAYMQGFHHIRYERTTAVSEGAECCDYRLRFDPEKK